MNKRSLLKWETHKNLASAAWLFISCFYVCTLFLINDSGVWKKCFTADWKQNVKKNIKQRNEKTSRNDSFFVICETVNENENLLTNVFLLS